MIPRMIPHDAARAPAVSRLAGGVSLAAGALSVAVHVWITRAVFVPLRLATGVEYVWISATAASLVATAAAASALMTISWAWFGTPLLRSDGATSGDEPKYVRYCENLYQGRGFDISDIKPLAQLPPDFHSQLWHNVVLLGRILPGELRALASD